MEKVAMEEVEALYKMAQLDLRKWPERSIWDPTSEAKRALIAYSKRDGVWVDVMARGQQQWGVPIAGRKNAAHVDRATFLHDLLPYIIQAREKRKR